MSSTLDALIKEARCWKGYEPVPGKAPYSNDSCRPAGSKKKKAKKETPLAKAAANLGLSGVSFDHDAGQMENALRMYAQARALARPSSEFLSRHNLDRPTFARTAKEIADTATGPRFDLDSMKANPTMRGWLGGAAGAVGGGALGSVGGVGSALAGAAIGGSAGGIAGYSSGTSKNRRLLHTLKALKGLGILTPEVLQRAQPLL